MKLADYINNWNKVIKSWMSSPSVSSYPNSYGVCIQSDYMPEPFMGDPDNYSFVIVNLNPGGGVCHSCEKQKKTVGMLINKVKRIGYSDAVKDFPYLRDEKAVGLTNWNSSPGRKWWKSKERWIKHMLHICDPSYDPKSTIPDEYFPFAMELFAWHTKKWPEDLNTKIEKSGVYGKNIYNDVIEPLHDAIRGSKYKFAFCVGKPIGTIIDSFGVFSKMNTSPIQPLSGVKRFYDIYHDGKGCYIINTWAQGGNTFPSKRFDTAEESICKIYGII